MEYYGPRYKLEVLANNADDHNPPEYLEKIKYVKLSKRVSLADRFRRTVIDGLKDLPFAPSVPVKSIPSRSLGERLGLGVAELNEPEDDVEMKVKSMSFSVLVKPPLTQQDYSVARTDTNHHHRPRTNQRTFPQHPVLVAKAVKVAARPQ